MSFPATHSKTDASYASLVILFKIHRTIAIRQEACRNQLAKLGWIKVTIGYMYRRVLELIFEGSESAWYDREAIYEELRHWKWLQLKLGVKQCMSK